MLSFKSSDYMRPWLVIAVAVIGTSLMPMAAQAVLLGGNVRVGLEDNLWLDKGVLATNGQLVERASEILSRLGARVLTPAEGRIKMGLKKRG